MCAIITLPENDGNYVQVQKHKGTFLSLKFMTLEFCWYVIESWHQMTPKHTECFQCTIWCLHMMTKKNNFLLQNAHSVTKLSQQRLQKLKIFSIRVFQVWNTNLSNQIVGWLLPWLWRKNCYKNCFFRMVCTRKAILDDLPAKGLNQMQTDW